MNIYNIYIYNIDIHIHYIASKKYMQQYMYIHMKSHCKDGRFPNVNRFVKFLKDQQYLV